MAVTGQTVLNPVSGERITFRTTAAESNVELVAIDLELPSGARVPGPLHLHPLQEERFEVVKGTMRFRVRRERMIAGAGEVVVVPPRVRHDFANVGEETALVRVEIRPALKMEQMFETAVALAEQGRTMFGGVPKPLELALFTREFEQEVQAAFPPPAPGAWRSHRWPGSPDAASAVSITCARPPAVRSRMHPCSKGVHHDPSRQPFSQYSAMSDYATAHARAEAQAAAVRDDPAARLALMARVFRGPTGHAPRHLPFRRAALSFMRWQARRGVLNPLDASAARQRVVAGGQRATTAGRMRNDRAAGWVGRLAVVAGRATLD